MFRIGTSIILSLLVACDGGLVIKDSDSGDTGPIDDPHADGDRDGYVVNDDCDDTDPAINPGAVELCDAADVDEDCDDLADDADAGPVGTTLWYVDADADGYGWLGAPLEACDLPAGYAPNADDCDDDDATRSPGAIEVCDDADVDEDCNGLADDADPAASAQITWHADVDLDGYGDPATGVVACEAPAAYIADGTDCDDADPAVNPGAVERCEAAGLDEDCDGLVNDADDSQAADGLTVWYPDADGDLFGDGEGARDACAQPDAHVTNGDDCDDAEPTVHPDASEVCDDGMDNNCDGGLVPCGLTGTINLSRGTAEAKITGEGIADSLSVYQGTGPGGDLNGDGLADVLVGGYQADGLTGSTGVAYVFYGAFSGLISAVAADATLQGEASGDLFGATVLGAFDADGDGLDDVAVGALGRTEAFTDCGAVYLFHGPLAGTYAPSDADTFWEGTFTTDNLGGSLSSDDLDGDAQDDLLIGSYGADLVYVFRGPLPAGEQSLGSAVLTLSEAGVGKVVGTGGDTDGDGLPEIVVGDPEDDTADTNAGAVYLVAGSLTGALVLDADADLTAVGAAASAAAGASVSIGGDVNGDGYDDVVIGATGDSAAGLDAGAVFVLFGPASGYQDLSTYDLKLTAEAAGAGVGSAIAFVGDISADGEPDLVIGASDDDDGGVDAGGAYVLFGPLTASMSLADADGKLVGETAGDAAGARVSAAGDVDGDGDPDVVIGAAYDDDGGTSSGAAYLLLGGGL